MSQPREKVFLMFAANIVLTVIVAFGAVTLLRPKDDKGMPTSRDGLAARLDEQSARIDEMGEKLTEVGEANTSLRIRVAEAEAEIARLRAGGGSGEEFAAAGGAEGAATKPKSDSEKLAEGIAAMMKQQIARQRERFIQDIINPTEDSKRRQEREVGRMAEQAVRALDLDERDAAEVRRILTDVDQRRRERLRQLFTSKSDPNDVTYPEVKEVLDDSFEEEDRMIEASLPADKADEYQESAKPIRNFIYVAASTAFPSGEEEGR
jgi:hypothetical protein